MRINATALAVSLLGLLWLIRKGESLTSMQAVFILCALYAVPLALLEFAWIKPYRRTMRFEQTAPFQPKRVAIKLLGLTTTCSIVLVVYWLFPEYHGAFYDRYYQMLRALAPWFVGLALPYVILIDRYGKEAQDGYWHLGMVTLLQWRFVDWRMVGQHLLGWLVKLFFLPLMFIYMSNKVAYLRFYDYQQVFGNFTSVYDFLYQLLFYIDLLIVTVGYVCSFKLTDSHVRSTEPTFFGWAIALLCYQPFWALIFASYLHYKPDKAWGAWLADYSFAYGLWGCLILVMISIYAWASLAFGLRFSNLTHRGILTNGPYRYCKHPAYVAKNLSWWLITMPFMVSVSIEESIRLCLLLLSLNMVYLLRARTEERHLSWDADYVAYAEYIEKHGILRWVGRAVPVLRFKPGRLFNLETAVESRIRREY